MNVNEVAERLGVSPVTANMLLTSGKLKGAKVAKKEGGKIMVWSVTEENLAAYQLTKKTATRKPYTKKQAKPPSGLVAQQPKSSNGHQPNREPIIRRVIDEWIDELVASKRIAGLGELTRNDVLNLAHRIKRVA